MANARGHFLWHELYTSDIKGAFAFYGKVIGWKPQAWDENQNYSRANSGRR